MKIFLNICILICFLQFDNIQSQELFDKHMQLQDLIRRAEQLHTSTLHELNTNSIDEIDNKCGLWLSFQIAQHWSEFDIQQRKYLMKILSPKLSQVDTIIGYFHIYYDTTGPNVPALLDDSSQRIPGTAKDFVDSVGYYLNYTWKYFIDSLGYSPPPFQIGETHYKIIIEELGMYQLYGETNFTQDDLYGKFQPPRYTSYIRIDNDFKDLKSEGISGLKVTCAHELHHAFQLGSYGYLQNEIYFYEITSTWMEDLLYDDVNDYYQYIKSRLNYPRGQFKYPDISFTSSDPTVTYSRAIWGKFVEKRFSKDAMRIAWENIRSGESSLNAIDHSLNLYGSNFRKAFLEWTIWNNNTGPNCDTIRFYTEGKQYPKIETRLPIEYLNSYRSFCDSIEPISSIYHPICLLQSSSDNCNNSPQMMVIVSNLNINGLNNYRYNFTYELSPTGGEGYTLLKNNIYIKLNSSDPENWVSQEDVPSILSSEVFVYPNPFNPKKSTQLTFRLPVYFEKKASVYIFSSGMDKVASKELDIISPDFEPRVEWDGRDNRGEFISTGVYFYMIIVSDKEYIGKFSVIRE